MIFVYLGSLLYFVSPRFWKTK